MVSIFTFEVAATKTESEVEVSLSTEMELKVSLIVLYIKLMNDINRSKLMILSIEKYIH